MSVNYAWTESIHDLFIPSFFTDWSLEVFSMKDFYTELYLNMFIIAVDVDSNYLWCIFTESVL